MATFMLFITFTDYMRHDAVYAIDISFHFITTYHTHIVFYVTVSLHALLAWYRHFDADTLMLGHYSWAMMLSHAIDFHYAIFFHDWFHYRLLLISLHIIRHYWLPRHYYFFFFSFTISYAVAPLLNTPPRFSLPLITFITRRRHAIFSRLAYALLRLFLFCRLRHLRHVSSPPYWCFPSSYCRWDAFFFTAIYVIADAAIYHYRFHYISLALFLHLFSSYCFRIMTLIFIYIYFIMIAILIIGFIGFAAALLAIIYTPLLAALADEIYHYYIIFMPHYRFGMPRATAITFATIHTPDTLMSAGFHITRRWRLRRLMPPPRWLRHTLRHTMPRCHFLFSFAAFHRYAISPLLPHYYAFMHSQRYAIGRLYFAHYYFSLSFFHIADMAITPLILSRCRHVTPLHTDYTLFITLRGLLAVHITLTPRYHYAVSRRHYAYWLLPHMTTFHYWYASLLSYFHAMPHCFEILILRLITLPPFRRPQYFAVTTLFRDIILRSILPLTRFWHFAADLYVIDMFADAATPWHYATPAFHAPRHVAIFRAVYAYFVAVSLPACCCLSATPKLPFDAYDKSATMPLMLWHFHGYAEICRHEIISIYDYFSSLMPMLITLTPMLHFLSFACVFNIFCCRHAWWLYAFRATLRAAAAFIEPLRFITITLTAIISFNIISFTIFAITITLSYFSRFLSLIKYFDYDFDIITILRHACWLFISSFSPLIIIFDFAYCSHFSASFMPEIAISLRHYATPRHAEMPSLLRYYAAIFTLSFIDAPLRHITYAMPCRHAAAITLTLIAFFIDDDAFALMPYAIADNANTLTLWLRITSLIYADYYLFYAVTLLSPCRRHFSSLLDAVIAFAAIFVVLLLYFLSFTRYLMLIRHILSLITVYRLVLMPAIILITLPLF